MSASDVLLVTGGGKGIAAECALHLARSRREAHVQRTRAHLAEKHIQETCSICIHVYLSVLLVFRRLGQKSSPTAKLKVKQAH